MSLHVPGPGGDMLARARQQADAANQAEQQLRMMLQQALERPHTVEMINVSACALLKENGAHVLRVGTVTGKRFDVVLSDGVVAAIARAANAQDDEQQAAA